MFRRTVSLTGLLSFLILLASSVVLYFEPHGRVAYWADWRFLGLTKSDWDHMHLGVGTLFVVAGLLHVWLNWKPITTYMKNSARQMVVLTPAMVAALALTLYFTVGSVVGLPVAQQVLDFSEHLKERQTETYGNPPYGHAELSPLDRFAGVLGLDPDQAVDALNQAGLTGVDRKARVVDVANANDMSPQQVYDLIRTALATDPFAALPPNPPEGTGRMTLAQICDNYGLPLEQAVERLAAGGIDHDPDATLKELAAKADTSPRELYQLLRTGP